MLQQMVSVCSTGDVSSRETYHWQNTSQQQWNAGMQNQGTIVCMDVGFMLHAYATCCFDGWLDALLSYALYITWQTM